ncbi:MAG: hypothetical protein H8E66_17260 [Planctomycetes bacterium]|nr:hypothetical protein [Planctomycetota bacterium]
MKSTFFYLSGAIALAVGTTLSWTVWSASVDAQDASPPPPQPASRAPVPGEPVHSSTFGFQQPTPSQQLSPGKPVHIPLGYPAGVPQYYPGYTIRQTNGRASYAATLLPSGDAKALEFTKEYQAQQVEINKLLKEYNGAENELDKGSVRDEIVKATLTQFDLRQKVRVREVEQLKKRLAVVETTVKQRNELKEKIVEKRVADLLREPDQLGWEPLAGGISTQGRQIAATQLPGPGATRYAPANTPTVNRLVPRTINRIVTETIVDEQGNQKTVSRPVTETELVEVENTTHNRRVPGDGGDASIGGRQTSKFTDSFDPSAGRALNSGFVYRTQTNSTVAEAAARVRFAEQKRSVLLGQGEQDTDGSQLKLLDAELELAKLVHARALAEYEGRTQLLELDVRQAQVDLEEADGRFKESQEVSKRSPGSFPKAELTAIRAAVDKAQIALERAKLVLDLHKKTNELKPKGDSPPADQKLRVK